LHDWQWKVLPQEHPEAVETCLIYVESGCLVYRSKLGVGGEKTPYAKEHSWLGVLLLEILKLGAGIRRLPDYVNPRAHGGSKRSGDKGF